jgi:Tol biopolymer transport system component
MKRNVSIFCLLVLSATFLPSQPTDFPKLTGPYLGQKPPGMTPEVFAPGIVSTGNHELDIAFTPDGNEAFITRSGPDYYSAILQFKRNKGFWTGPIMSEFSGRFQNNYPFVSPDGSKIFFNSLEPVGQSDSKDENSSIFVSEKTDSGWNRGRPIDPGIVSNGTESFVSVSSNGNLYFGARYKDGLGGSDIYMCEFQSNGYGKAVNLGLAINSEHNEFHAFIAPDESFLLFDARRPDGSGENDLYVSFRSANGQWGVASSLGKAINTEYSESRPYVSPDGRYLFFCSNRVNPHVEAHEKSLTYVDFQSRITGPGNGNQDIYWVDAKIIYDLRPKELK